MLFLKRHFSVPIFELQRACLSYFFRKLNHISNDRQRTYSKSRRKNVRNYEVFKGKQNHRLWLHAATTFASVDSVGWPTRANGWSFSTWNSEPWVKMPRTREEASENEARMQIQRVTNPDRNWDMEPALYDPSSRGDSSTRSEDPWRSTGIPR